MLRWIVGAPLLLLLVLFALSNPQPVRLTIWPFDLALEAPLSLAVLLAMGAAFLLGALIAWFGTLAAIARARRAEEKVRLLDAQVSELKARLPPPA
jgi:uncharacterized integral membrane protein